MHSELDINQIFARNVKAFCLEKNVSLKDLGLDKEDERRLESILDGNIDIEIDLKFLGRIANALNVLAYLLLK